MNDEQVKELMNNPQKLEEELRKFFAEIDKENKGYVSFETVHQSLHKAYEKYGKKIEESEHKPGELEKAREICDPKNTGKVEYEGFKALVLYAMKHQSEHGKHHH